MIKWYRHIPMQRKILLIYLLLVLLILTLIFTAVLVKTAIDEDERHNAILQQGNELINEKLNVIMEDIRYTSSMYLVNTDIIAAMENDFYKGKSQYVDTLQELRKNTLSVKINPNISSITYLTNSGKVYSGAGYNQQYITKLSEIAATMSQGDIRHYVTPAYETTINQQTVMTITYAFRLTNPYVFKPVGYGFINLDMKRLAQSFEVLTLSETVNMMAVQNGAPLFRSAGVSQELASAITVGLQRHEDQLPANDRRTFHVTAGGKQYLCATQWNEMLGLAILNFVPIEIVNAKVSSGVQFYQATVIAMLLVFIVVSFLVSLRMTKPIRILQGGMKRAEGGNLMPIVEQAERLDDMGDLIRGFNRMLSELQQSILREYASKDMEKKAQIKMLQSQINPHFLYNALNLISSIAEIENVPEVTSIAINLGDLYRYNISGSFKVTLREEISQVERYIAIQQLCMTGSFEVIYQIDSKLQERRVLKFLLQPLVENAFIHGFGKTVSGGTLRVTAEREGESLLLTIKDDGVGISPKRLIYLQQRCADSVALYTEETGSIGLLNVNFRLKATYGEDCGLRIHSQEGRGTVIQMLIPWAEEGRI